MPPDQKPETEPSKTWTGSRILAAIAAFVTAVAAILAAMYAKGQIDAADQQKVASQQTQLLALVVDIEQVQVEIDTPKVERGPLSTSVELENELTSYAQAAEGVIGSLTSDDVAPFEYVQVGKALAGSGNNRQAMVYFARAASARSAPPDTVAAADRNWAIVLYGLKDPTAGHQKMMQAVGAFASKLYITPSDADNNVAQSYLADAGEQLSIKGCVLARADIAAAKMSLPLLREKKPPKANQDVSLLTEDDKAEHQNCGATA